MKSIVNHIPIAFAVGLLLLAACDPKSPCDEGQYELRGSCLLLDAGTSDASDAASDGPAPECEADASDAYSGFGDPCTDQAECPCAANVCNTVFMQCTRLSCLEDETVCPPDWTCLDLTGLSDEADSICVPPG